LAGGGGDVGRFLTATAAEEPQTSLALFTAAAAAAAAAAETVTGELDAASMARGDGSSRA